jgi:hypothetical protein
MYHYTKYCTQADADGAVIFDPGSSNGSKTDGVRMKPNIR